MKSIIQPNNRTVLLNYFAEKNQNTKNHLKKSLFWDSQHIYSENIILKSKLKDLNEANTQTKTKLLMSEKQVYALMVKNKEKEQHLGISHTRSSTKLNRFDRIISTDSFNSNKLTVQSHNKMVFQMRQLIRSLKEQIFSLKSQVSTLKKSMKNTRMNELQAQNKELQQQNIRLYKLANQAKRKQQEYLQYLKLQIQQHKSLIRKEAQSKHSVMRQMATLKRQLQEAKKTNQKDLIIKRQKYKKPIRQIEQRNKINPETNHRQQMKLNCKSKENDVLQEIPTLKLEYSISGIDRMDSNTINYDKLIGTEQQIKSSLKLPSNINLTSLENLQKPSFISKDSSNQLSVHQQVTEKSAQNKQNNSRNYQDENDQEQEFYPKITKNMRNTPQKQRLSEQLGIYTAPKKQKASGVYEVISEIEQNNGNQSEYEDLMQKDT